MRDHLADDIAKKPRLIRKTGEGLHHHHIGKRILRIAGKLGMQRFNLALRAFRTADDKGRKAAKNQYQDNKKQPKAPIQDQRKGQQHNGGNESGQVFAEKGQPKPKKIIRAHQHDLHQPARLRIPMKG